MNEDQIKNEYSKKIRLFKKYNKYYYDKSNPIVSDQEFDVLKNDIIELEKKYIFLNSEFSPSKSVGFKPSKNFKKVNHKSPMLSLGNAFTKEDLLNFEKKYLIISIKKRF